MLYLIALPALISMFVFSYLPMGGIILAFKDYSPRLSMWNSAWMEPLLAHFKTAFSGTDFWQVTLNTLRISCLRLLFGLPAPILLALFLNEVRHKKYKKLVQTIVYLPHFLSWVVLAGMIRTIMSGDGLINTTLQGLGLKGIPFLTDENWFLFTLVFTDIWKGVGYGSIIYMAAISGIDQQQYEAATIDGASRWQKMRYITLPGMAMAITVNVILSLSGILNGGFDQIFNLYSPVVYGKADIIDTYVYRMGIVAGDYGAATALGLVKSVIAFILIVSTNKIIKKLGGEPIW
ncbi:MAG: ABC transporter permease subunit [Firmicutes bacterium]|nr:ABC transporter permease subunit [Bacillota bacterium]